MIFEPPGDCGLCPRLAGFRRRWQSAEPQWHNAPVPSWLPPEGEESVKLLVIGLAPGLRGANRTGRPFTGDYAGDLLYETLGKFGFARGQYGATPSDGLQLASAAITNAVRCVPPENKPVGAEINNCRPFLAATLERFGALSVLVTLGKIAHDSTVRALGGRVAEHPFGHAAVTRIGEYAIVSSYHCSRYNTNTGRLTPQMFESVFARASALLEGAE